MGRILVGTSTITLMPTAYTPQLEPLKAHTARLLDDLVAALRLWKHTTVGLVWFDAELDTGGRCIFIDDNAGTVFYTLRVCMDGWEAIDHTRDNLRALLAATLDTLLTYGIAWLQAEGRLLRPTPQPQAAYSGTFH